MNGGNSSNALEVVNTQKRMMEYDSVVKSLNARRKEKKPFPIVNYMKEKVNTEKIPDLGDTYTLLSQLILESAEGSAPGERAFAKGYMAEDQSRERCDVLTKLISNGTAWLERAFATHVNKVLADNVKEIQVGGVPGFRSKVSAFVGWKFGNHPISAQLEVRDRHLGCSNRNIGAVPDYSWLFVYRKLQIPFSGSKCFTSCVAGGPKMR